MDSVADDLRRETARALAALSPAERVALALQLGRRDLARFASARGLGEREARALLAAARRRGRRPSRCTGEVES
jgi:hypothetical protein